MKLSSMTLRTLLMIVASASTLVAWFNPGVGVVDSKMLVSNDFRYFGPTERLRNLTEYAAWERRIPVKDGRWSPPKNPSPPRGVKFQLHDYLVMPVGELTSDTRWPNVSGYHFRLRLGGQLLILDDIEREQGSCAQELGIPKQAVIWYTRVHIPLICDLTIIIMAIAIPVLSHFDWLLRYLACRAKDVLTRP